MTWLTFATVVGATTRLTRLVTQDRILAFVRRAAANADARMRARRGALDGETGPLYGFITCPWCVSVWIAIALGALVAICHGDTLTLIDALLGALTASHVAGHLLTRTSGS